MKKDIGVFKKGSSDPYAVIKGKLMDNSLLFVEAAIMILLFEGNVWQTCYPLSLIHRALVTKIGDITQ